MTTTTGQTYEVQGRLLEVCTCKSAVPVLAGRGPRRRRHLRLDPGLVRRQRNRAGRRRFDRCICVSVHIPGNVLAGNWKAAVLVDDQCSEEQQQALLSVFTGQLGGAVADLAALIGEVVAVERVPIAFDVVDGKGEIRIGDLPRPS